MATCPICKSNAELIEPGFFEGITFRCAKHDEFDVSDTVLSISDLMNADSARWEKALKAASGRAAPGKRPRILSYDF